MYIDSKLFKRFFDITMDQLMDERGTNRFELIMKNPEMKKRLLDLAKRLDEIHKS